MDRTERPPHFASFQLVGKISLWFTVVASVGLVAVVVLSGVPDTDYLETFRSLIATRDQLPVVMLIGGLVLTIGTGLTTWLITLYASFRVVGPMHRFARNLEAGVRTGKVPEIRIRSTDFLQSESDLLHSSVGVLYRHYGEIDRLAVETVKAARLGHLDKASQFIRLMNQQQGRLRYDALPPHQN